MTDHFSSGHVSYTHIRTLVESSGENSVPVMCSRVSSPYRRSTIIPCRDPPPDTDVGSRWRLRSASMSRLVIPSTRRTTLGDRAFPVTAVRAWNALQSSIRCAPSLLQFRRELKMALFQSSYCSPYCPAVWQTVTFNTVTDFTLTLQYITVDTVSVSYDSTALYKCFYYYYHKPQHIYAKDYITCKCIDYVAICRFWYMLF